MPRKPRPPEVEQSTNDADNAPPAVPDERSPIDPMGAPDAPTVLAQDDDGELVEVINADAPPKRQKRSKKAERRAKEAEDRIEDTVAGWPPIPDKRSSTETRVRFIIGLMADGKWECYLSRAPLAQAWGVSDSRIKQYSAEAFRRLNFDDPAEIAERRISLVRWVAKLRERAARATNDVTGLPEWADCLKAVELEAKLLGIEIDSKRRLEVTSPDGLGLAELFVRLDEKPASTPPEEPQASPKPKRMRKPKA